MLKLSSLVSEFEEALHVKFALDLRLKDTASEFLEGMKKHKAVRKGERIARLFTSVNQKFDTNEASLSRFFGFFGQQKITFNIHEKREIEAAYNRNDRRAFDAALERRGLSINASDLFTPASREITLSILHRELASPTLKRKDSKPRSWRTEILQSLFGAFVFSAYEVQAVHDFFDPDTLNNSYEPDFWLHLHRSRPHLFSRERSLSYVEVPPSTSLEAINARIQSEYDMLCNHGHLALHFRDWDATKWSAIASATVFAEKFKPEKLRNGFFRHDVIERVTRGHVPLDKQHDYKFHVADLGFHYKDTFVIGDANEILVLFQKNLSDETLIPCPTCRSHNVQGNSYSSLGIKSWECNNALCPDRSKFNRGKRYSFYQLLKQRAIEDERNVISTSSVRKWSRDVQPIESKDDLLPMVARHYTLAGDGVLLVARRSRSLLHRQVKFVKANKYFATANPLNSPPLKDTAFFGRFLSDCNTTVDDAPRSENVDGISALLGDSTRILKGMKAASLDGAVTSPPYYNAREYSQWDNIYCYLFDMYRNGKEVLRVLKPGAHYLFNIFDYFDNENTVALSAMGNKRMILSAFITVIFEAIGFELAGNIVWDKGDIEGKRAFNNGNFSPYYQAPFNCWEHILVFKKPGSGIGLTEPLPHLIRAKPVLKMVRGENRHGHTAPFPTAIPDLLIKRLPLDATILDPYAGSMTTGYAAASAGRRSVCIERDKDYFELGLKNLRSAKAQLALL